MVAWGRGGGKGREGSGEGEGARRLRWDRKRGDFDYMNPFMKVKQNKIYPPALSRQVVTGQV